jgi:predicted enzyme related to lactoylglutathione lyase
MPWRRREVTEMSTVNLSYVSIFTRDVARLPTFYVEVFGLEEIMASGSDRYRELDLGAVKLGFPLVDAYAALDLQDQADPTGVRAMLTFAANSAAKVEELAGRAVARGARLAKSGFPTAFGQYVAVVLDPEGNAVRISAPLSPLPVA